jgi:SAM-dependent methyltransferase
MSMTGREDDIWQGAYKLPWGDPDFSARTLREHLSQEHELASRRRVWIDRQVAWIHGTLLGGRAVRILDLGCGPGFYAHRLAGLGHRCHGIDIGPASIAHARQHNPAPERCTFARGDLREVSFGDSHQYELIMMIYGELNVFAPDEVRSLLRRASTSLVPGGRLICEVQIPAAVEASGRAEPTEVRSPAGLFSPHPHTCRTESHWWADQRVAVQTFTITEDRNTAGVGDLPAARTVTEEGNSPETSSREPSMPAPSTPAPSRTPEARGSAAPAIYRSTTQAWLDEELVSLFQEAEFCSATPREDWPCNTDSLRLWVAEVS